MKIRDVKKYIKYQLLIGIEGERNILVIKIIGHHKDGNTEKIIDLKHLVTPEIT